MSRYLLSREGIAMSDRDRRIKSLRIIDEYYWILIRHIQDAVQKRLGQPGMAAVAEGFRQYGRYRGQSLYDAPLISAEGRDAMSLLRAWDHGDLMLAQADGRLKTEGGPRRSTVKLDRVPGSDYFAAHKVPAGILETYWHETLQGLAEGFDAAMTASSVAIPQSSTAPWSITFDYAGTSSGRSDAPPSDAFDDEERAIRLFRRTMGVLGALGMYVGRVLVERFDAAGEEVMREALYNFGAERGRGMREQAIAEGLPIDLKTWTDIMQRRDPKAATFVFRPETHITPGVFHVVCTHCPAADVWAEEGPKGLSFGYLYDVAVHRGLVEAFNPNATVAWEKVKTRGDKICSFRFLIPELVTKSDPEWARKAAGLV